MGHRRFSREDVDKGLSALIITDNSARAAELTGFKADTILNWRDKNPERYEQLRTELHPKVAEQLASDAEQLTHRYQEAQRQTITRYMNKIDDLNAKDLAGAARNLGTAAALTVDKISSPLRERPSHVQQGTDLEGLVHRMARLLGTQTPQHVPNHAELDEAQVVDTEATAEPDVRSSASVHT